MKMLHDALDKGHLSVRRAAKTMGIDVIALEQLFVGHKLSVPFQL